MKYRTLVMCVFMSLFTLFGCSVNGSGRAQSAAIKANDASDASQPKRVYYLQHKLIAQWVFESDGEFFFDLYNRRFEKLLEAVSEIVNPEYAKGIVFTPIYDQNSVVIKFPEPKSLANCYFVLVKKDGDTYSYFTYEKTIDLGGVGVIGVLGGWNAEGTHSNYGPREYKTEADFIKDVLDFEKSG